MAKSRSAYPDGKPTPTHRHRKPIPLNVGLASMKEFFPLLQIQNKAKLRAGEVGGGGNPLAGLRRRRSEPPQIHSVAV